MHRHYNHDRHNPEIDRPNNSNTEQWDQNSQVWQNHQNHPLDFRNTGNQDHNNTGNNSRIHDYRNQPAHNGFRYEDPTYGHAGNPRNGNDRGRNQSDYGTGGTYGASRNYGSMGSYGGAQGFGTASGGNNIGHSGSGFNSDSGRADRQNYQPVQHRVYGAYRDHNSFAPGEKAQYDGSSRYGSQGADNSRRFLNRNEEVERPESRYGNNHSNRSRDDNSRYEIYDTSQAQYNRGEYGNTSHGTVTNTFHQRTSDQYENSDEYKYGSRQRGRNRQGDGNDQDQRYTSDLYQGNSSGFENNGRDQYSNQAGRNNRYYNNNGDAWNPGAERNM